MMNASPNLINELEKNKSFTVFVAIILGQASLECRRFGICKMQTIDTEEELLSTPFDCLAYLSLLPDGLLLLELLQEWMTDEIYLKYFAVGHFLMKENFAIPFSVLRLFPEKKRLIIPAGKYPVKGNAIIFYPQQEIAA